MVDTRTRLMVKLTLRLFTQHFKLPICLMKKPLTAVKSRGFDAPALLTEGDETFYAMVISITTQLKAHKSRYVEKYCMSWSACKTPS